VWSEGKTDSTSTLPITLKDVADFNVSATGVKAIYNSDGREASDWVREPTKGLKGVDAPQFSSGLKVKEGPGCRGTMVHGALGYLTTVGNNLQKSDTDVFFTSSCSSMAHGISVMPGESFRRCTALYAARKLVTDAWSIHTDEYLAPTDTVDAYRQWNDDTIVYALLHGKNNCTAMRDVQYKGKAHRIKNHWFWRTREESRALYDRPDTPFLAAQWRHALRDLNVTEAFDAKKLLKHLLTLRTTTEEPLRQRILALDQEITTLDQTIATKEFALNTLVYQLYHLTPVEIAMAEGR
jgi:hypothetical protein